MAYETGGSSLFGMVSDYPGVLLSNAFRGRLLEAGLTPLDLRNMLPEDRMSFADRMKEAAGGGPLVGALIETALNPWVWAAAAMAVPFRMTPIDEVWKVGLDYMPTVRKQAPLMSQFKMLTAQEELMGSDAIAVLRSIEKGQEEFVRLSDEAVIARNALASKLGLRYIEQDPTLARVLSAKLQGLDRSRTQPYVRASKKGIRDADGNIDRVLRVSEKQYEPLLDTQKLDDYLVSKGIKDEADEYLRKTDEAYERMFRALFQKQDDAGAWTMDSDKIQRIVAGLQRGPDGRVYRDAIRGTPIEPMFGPEMIRAMGEGRISAGQFEDLLGRMVQQRAWYQPFNANQMFVMEGGSLRKIGESELPRIMKKMGDRPKLFRSMMERERRQAIYNPDDLEDLRQFKVGFNEDRLDEFELAVERSRRYLKARADDAVEGEVLGMPLLNSERSFEKYVREGARNYGLHVKTPDDFLVSQQREARARMVQAHKEGLITDEEMERLKSRSYRRNRAGRSRSIMEDSGLGEHMPDGGFSLYDALQASTGIIADPTARDHLNRVIVPRILGHTTLQEGALTASVNWSKGLMRNFLNQNHPWVKAVPEGPAKRWLTSLRQAAETPIKDPMLVDREVASFFYGSTLGANVGSVMLNMMQPLMTLPRIMGIDSVSAGFAGAMGDMTRYATLRTQQLTSGGGGLRQRMLLGPELRGVKQATIERSFKYARAAEIGPDIQDSLEHVRRPLQPGLRRGVNGFYEDMQDVLLKLFEKGEMFNRSWTSHATAHAAAKRGITGGPELENLIRVTGEQTQFGARLLNTPMFMLDQEGFASMFTQPWVRQFLMFPTRMVTGVAYQGRRVGGGGIQKALRTGNPADALISFRDSIRALATSAIVYEVGKELTGANLTAGTIVGATVGGLRESGPGAPLPIPPALGLPLMTIQWLQTGDAEVMKYTLPTLIPGGVAISRALSNAGPEIPQLTKTRFQRSYVDWGNPTPDGLFPLMSPDGRVISFESPVGIAARAAGVDMGRFRDESELIGYMTRMRDQMVEDKRKFLQAMSSGRIQDAETVKRKFREKYGMELQVTGQQIKAFTRTKSTSRVERTLELMPREIRSQFIPIAQEILGPRAGVDLRAGASITDRNPARIPGHQFSPEVESTLQDMAAEARARGARSFPQEPY